MSRTFALAWLLSLAVSQAQVRFEEYRLPAGLNPGDIALQDMTGDGLLDIVYASIIAGEIRVIVQQEYLVFSMPIETGFIGFESRDFAFSDWNGDGAMDLITPLTCENSLLLLFGNGEGVLSPSVDIVVPGQPWHVELIDLNGDAYDDIFLIEDVNSKGYLITYDAATGFAVAESFSMAFSPIDLVSTGIDRDGVRDYISLHASGDIQFWKGGQQGVSLVAASKTNLFSSFVTLTDVDGDSDEDLFINHSLLGHATFVERTEYGFAAEPWTATSVPGTSIFYDSDAGDFDGDGDRDLVALTEIGLFTNENLGHGRFKGWELASPQDGSRVAISDFNGDGKADIAVTATLTDEIVLLVSL